VQDLSYDEILNENLAIVKELLPDYVPADGDNIMLVLRAFSYRELHLRAYFNKLAKAFFLSTASGSDLDNLAETLYGMYRLKGSKPYAKAEFNLTAPLTYDYLIPAGFELTNETGEYFAKLKEDVVIKAGEISAVGVLELQKEISYLDVKTEIQVTPLPYVQVKQLEAFKNGSNPESDEKFKARIRVSFADKSTAGSALTYKSYALKADERIEQVNILSPSAGVVDVVYYSPYADEIMQKRIEEMLNADDVRPLTDLVQVKKANEVLFNVEGEIVIKEGVDGASVYTNAIENLKTLKFRIGEDVSIAKIIHYLMVDGVIDVNITNPTQNIEIDEYSIAVLNNANISYRVSNEL